MRIRIAIAGLAMVCACLHLAASAGADMLGIFGTIDSVVFEPDEVRAERIQLWGVFGYADCCGGVSQVERGYLYFRLPTVAEPATEKLVKLARTEWADFKSIAGTQQAVGFGFWSDPGPIRGLKKTGARILSAVYEVAFVPVNAAQKALRIRRPSEPPASPAEYRTDIGIVRLSPIGNNADIVRLLRDAP